MVVHDDLVVVDKYDGVLGRLVDVVNLIAFELQPNLVIGPAQGRKRDTPPVTADRTMRVAEEQVPQIAATRDDVGDCLLLGEPDPVDTGQVQIERRMMHEQVNRFVTEAVQGLSQPGLPGGAEDTTMGSRLDRVEQDEFAGAGIDHRLHESLFVGDRVGKVLQEAAAVADDVVQRDPDNTRARALQSSIRKAIGGS